MDILFFQKKIEGLAHELIMMKYDNLTSKELSSQIILRTRGFGRNPYRTELFYYLQFKKPKILGLNPAIR